MDKMVPYYTLHGLVNYDHNVWSRTILVHLVLVLIPSSSTPSSVGLVNVVHFPRHRGTVVAAQSAPLWIRTVHVQAA
jgi:hypothetical protein